MKLGKLAFFIAVLVACASAQAAGDHRGHAGHAGATQATALSQAGATMSDAEVRKIDKEQGKITLKHGEIKNLDMPPMTMVFRVKDPAMLGNLKEGDRVRFSADKVGGQYTVTGIETKK